MDTEYKYNEYLMYKIRDSIYIRDIPFKNLFILFNPHPAVINLIDMELIMEENFCLSYYGSRVVLDILSRYPEKIHFGYLNSNNSDYAMMLLEKYPEKIDSSLSNNTSEYAMKLLERNPQHISWMDLSRNSTRGAVKILKNYENKICFSYLSMNKCADVIPLFEKYIDRIDLNAYIRAIVQCDIKNSNDQSLYLGYTDISQDILDFIIKYNKLIDFNGVDISMYCNKKLFDLVIYYKRLNNIDIDPIETDLHELMLLIRNYTSNKDRVYKLYNIYNKYILKHDLFKINSIEIYYFLRDNFEVPDTNICENPVLFTYDYDKMKANKKDLHDEFFNL